VYSAVQTYFSGKEQRRKPKVLFLCTDKGTGYLDTVYDNEWNDWLRKISENIKSSEENVIHP
jgi:cysteine synthase A